MSSALLEVSPVLLDLSSEEQATAHRVMQRLLPREKITQSESGVAYSKDMQGMGRAVKRAQADGFTIISGTNNRLLLDLDNGAVLHEANYHLLCELMHETPLCTRWPSKSKKGEHVVLQFANATFTPAEAIALEVALGSDPKRAVLYIKRIKNHIEEPRVLFKPALPASEHVCQW